MRMIRYFIAVLLLGPALIFAQEAQVVDKFAIAADGDKTASLVAKLAGVAPYYHLYDIKGNLLEVLPNPYLDRDWGIGPLAAAALADKGVTVLVAQRVPGPKMDDVLVARSIRLVRRLGTVQDVADELKEE